MPFYIYNGILHIVITEYGIDKIHMEQSNDDANDNNNIHFVNLLSFTLNDYLISSSIFLYIDPATPRREQFYSRQHLTATLASLQHLPCLLTRRHGAPYYTS